MATEQIQISPRLAIPETEIVERFVRASGAGGQNVNKVSTAVELRFDIAHSPSLPEPLRERLLARRDRRVTSEGVLVIDAQRFRTQDRNRQDARERLASFIQASLSVPKPRVATKPTYGSKLRRLDQKKERAQVKRGRSTRNWE
ncbi:alternative ribosome rescue aminoacyl-tRNA hydrolase ArfB [Stenotrophomonas sp.]|uniref:alternative ribosome rescue aminoacyl-tRNA hydrolase ArfB n=1 Tax=Stenotrophomonas sp. TaxID=69392 RepID=UPI0028A1D38D|nr:alternative ribosome rescue aminoacyl-tRNA hydrolase ArfB [Stenotrophomonas sp.]